MVIRIRRSHIFLAAFLALGAIACQDSGTPTVPGPDKPATPIGEKPVKCDGESIQERLKKNMKLEANAKVQIAPLAKKGTSTAGTWSAVDGDIYKAILKAIGIDPCNSDPKDLKGKPGFIEFEPNSGVLNPGATRATFGYFIKVNQGGTEVEYFALFSYDKITVGGKVICATEFFLFGPFARKGGKVDPDPPKLDKGLAINKDGCLLGEVPLELAKVINAAGIAAEGHGKDKDEAVKPGVDKKGEGCLVCHYGGGGFPNNTTPFPWGKE
jgi:hypothetical protein